MLAALAAFQFCWLWPKTIRGIGRLRSNTAASAASTFSTSCTSIGAVATITEASTHSPLSRTLHWHNNVLSFESDQINTRALQWRHSGELHLVHYNSMYGTYENAVNYADGLAVLGIFLEVCYNYDIDITVFDATWSWSKQQFSFAIE